MSVHSSDSDVVRCDDTHTQRYRAVNAEQRTQTELVVGQLATTLNYDRKKDTTKSILVDTDTSRVSDTYPHRQQLTISTFD